MNIGFLLFSKVHNKPETASSRIRGQWLINYWKEAEELRYGKKYDAIIYQKVYEPDHAKIFPGVKILDICDPDWLDYKIPFMDMVEQCDAITVPTEYLKRALQGWTNKPIVIIPDRHDLKYFKEKKIHTNKKATEVCWYGYSHNAGCLKSIRDFLNQYNLRISIITNEPIILSDKAGNMVVDERYTEWKLETVNQEIIKSDFVIMPGSRNPNSRFKSNNKTVNAWLLNMPVATCLEELEAFIDPLKRKEEAEKRYKLTRKEYDVKLNVQEMKNLINKIKKEKNARV